MGSRKFFCVQKVFNRVRAEAYNNKGRSSTAKKFYGNSESLCEEALEILQELVHADASIQQWFDRALDFDVDSALSSSPAGMPHVVTSRSLDKQQIDGRLMSKREVEIDTVEMAISTLLDAKAEDEKEQK